MISRLVLNTFVSVWLAGLAEIVTQQLSVTLILVRMERRVSISKHHTLVNVHQDGLVRIVPLPLISVCLTLVRTEQHVSVSRRPILVSVQPDGPDRIVPLPLMSVCPTHVRMEPHA